MLHFIRLTRPINLIIIALTMYSQGYYFDQLFSNSSTLGICSLDFGLLVFSTVIIAAAGNIINDYFDVKADRINKPKKMIIGVYIKRRWAIVLHWVMNFIAFSIAIYLSWKFHTFWYLFIHLLSINLLWIYSTNLKRKPLIGNIIVAGLTGLVPILIGFYYYHHQGLSIIDHVSGIINYPFATETSYHFIVLFSILLSGFAFVLNLAREIIKDIEDIEGDLDLKAKTLPIKFGAKNSKYIIITLLLVTIVFECIAISTCQLDLKTIWPLLVVIVFTVLTMLLLANPNNKLRLANNTIKIAMIFGMLSPLYWTLIS